MCFLFLLPNYANILVYFFLFALFSDEPEVFLPKYSQTAILHAAHFRRVVKHRTTLIVIGGAGLKAWRDYAVSTMQLACARPGVVGASLDGR